MTGGGIAGGVAGAVIATPLIPQYIPDNQAFFILGDDLDWRRRGDGRRLHLATGDDRNNDTTGG